jgi:hypothetical protein
VENLDLPVLLEMLLSELLDELPAAQHIRINHRWRTPTNPISNTVGPTTEKLDLLISAPYADKLPLKVAEYIRQDGSFAQNCFAPSEKIHVKNIFLSNGRECAGKRGK